MPGWQFFSFHSGRFDILVGHRYTTICVPPTDCSFLKLETPIIRRICFIVSRAPRSSFHMEEATPRVLKYTNKEDSITSEMSKGRSNGCIEWSPIYYCVRHLSTEYAVNICSSFHTQGTRIKPFRSRFNPEEHVTVRCAWCFPWEQEKSGSLEMSAALLSMSRSNVCFNDSVTGGSRFETLMHFSYSVW